MAEFRNRRDRKPEPFVPTWFKLWFAFCALIGIGFGALIVWAVIKLVNHFTT